MFYVWLALSLVIGVVSIYMFLIEVFSVAFKLTGLATSKIRFQVASLFTGTGFTTNESELIVNDDKRRKIALTCIYTGHIFSLVIMGLAVNVLFSIVQLAQSGASEPVYFDKWYNILFYVSVAFLLVMLLLKISPINKRFRSLLERIAIRSTKRTKTNIITVLDLYGKYAITEVILNKIPDFAVDTPLFEMGLTKQYSINVLSIKRGKRVVEVTKDTMFRVGDILVIYGLINDIKDAFINSVSGKKTMVIDKSNEITLVNNYGSNALVEVYVDDVPKELDGVAMKDAHLTDKFSIMIGVIKRKDEFIFPDKDTIIEKGDTLTIFGPYKNIKLLFKNDDSDREIFEQ